MVFLMLIVSVVSCMVYYCLLQVTGPFNSDSIAKLRQGLRPIRFLDILKIECCPPLKLSALGGYCGGSVF